MTKLSKAKRIRLAALLLGLAFVAGCAGTRTGAPSADGAASVPSQTATTPAPAARPETAETAASTDSAARKGPGAMIHKGSGALLKPPKQDAAAGTGNVSLNFEAADVRDIAKTVLAEILQESYVVDPKVSGTISFRTTRPLPREALLPTLETILRLNGTVMVKENGIFKIMPALSVKGSLSPKMGGSAAGYSVQVVPLKYIGSREMARILEAFAPDPASVKTDEIRNLLIVAGTQNEIQHMLDAVDMFDVDWLSGMSVGLFTLQSADVKTVEAEMNKILGDKNLNPLAGVVRVIPVERLNGFVIITPQPQYLEQAKAWLERLDRAGGTGGSRLYVYHVQNGKAEHLAELLNQTFGGGKAQTQAQTQARTPAPAVASGLTPTEIRSPTGTTAFGSTQTPTTPRTATAGGPSVTGATLTITDDGGTGSEVRVVADRENNALLILANVAGYEKIESALKRLDVAPRQVLIEVTIAEVTLTDELSYGVEWLFTNGPRKSGKLDLGAAGLSQLVPGFSYALTQVGSDALKAVLNALETDNRLSVLSSPHIMVADNQTAKIQVGDSVPAATSSTTNITTAAGTVTNTIQYLDTGVMLAVTPRINAGGLVNLEITQEVSTASKTTSSGLDSPTISKRSAKTQVAVQSGETMVLGGLISENSSRGSSGLPVLSSVPVLGALFGTQSLNNKKTELIVLITPRVASNFAQAKSISQELQRKMGQAKDLLDCGTSNVFGYMTRGGLWCMQPNRFEGKIDRMMDDAPATPAGAR